MLALDHIVFAGAQKDFSEEEYGQGSSIKAVKGGDHEIWGTYNYLAHFSNDSYIEWLGINDYEKAKQVDIPLIKHLIYSADQNQNGPIQFALRTNQMDSFVAHFEKQGIPYKGPYDGQRSKPDGTVLKWRMLFPEYDYTQEVLPFLIEWQTPNQVSSLFNPQAITSVTMNSDIEQFRHIYQLKPRKLLKNRVVLQNAKIFFAQDGDLTFKVE